MSDLTDSIAALNKAATDAENTTVFFNQVTTLGPTSTVTNIFNNVTVPSVQKQIKDLYDESETDINNAVNLAEEAANRAESASSGSLTLDEAKASTELTLNDVLIISDRAMSAFKVVDATTVETNKYTIIECTGVPEVALELMHNGTISLDSLGVSATEDASDAFNLVAGYASVYKVVGTGKYVFKQQLRLKSYLKVDFTGIKVDVEDGADSLFYAPAGILEFSIEGGTYNNSDVTGYPVTSWFKGDGEPNGAGSADNNYSKNYSISKVKVHGFNWLMDCYYSRTWNLSDFFSYGHNGIKTEGKCVEINISDGVIFGMSGRFPTEETRGIYITDGGNTADQYGEGIKCSFVTIDAFSVAVDIDSGLDLAVTNCWLGSYYENHTVRFTQGGTNLFADIFFTDNTIHGGKIEFVSHATPVAYANVKFMGGQYTGSQSMTVGNFWHGVEFSDFTYRNSTATIVVAPFLFQYDNQDIVLNDIKYRGGEFNKLAQVYSTSSSGLFNNLWCDNYVEQPFYCESPIKMTNCPQGVITGGDRFGPIIKAGTIPNALYTYGSELLNTQVVMSEGAQVELTVGGTFVGHADNVTDAVISISLENSETVITGTGWSSQFLTIPLNCAFTGVYKIRFIATSNASSTLKIVNDTTAKIVADYHAWYTLEYV